MITAVFYDPDHGVFWAGMAFSGFLQVTAALLNLLPVPGLDGYGALEPHLSPDTQRALAPAKTYGLLILFVLFIVSPLGEYFFASSPGSSTSSASRGSSSATVCGSPSSGPPGCRAAPCDICVFTHRLDRMGAGHDHGGADTRVSRLLIAAGILSVFFVIELTTALLINSIALLADAGHMLTDLVAMFMGLTAVLLARHGSASAKRTYGWHRAEVFTAVANAVLLLFVAGFILYEAVERFGDAPAIPGVPMIVVALAGLIANAVVVLLLRSHAEGSLAVKGAYMEVVADTVGSVGVLIAGIVTVTTRWPYADVVVAVLVALWVLPRAIALARAALRILSESSPSHIDVEELRTALCGLDGVTEVHDLHVWTLVPGKDMATAHLTSTADSAKVLDEAKAVLAARGLEHATIQIETPDAAGDCHCEASW